MWGLGYSGSSGANQPLISADLTLFVECSEVGSSWETLRSPRPSSFGSFGVSCFCPGDDHPATQRKTVVQTVVIPAWPLAPVLTYLP